MRKLCWWAVPCSAAIFLAVYLLPQPWWLPAGAVCAVAALLGLLLRGKPRLRVMLAALGLAAGFLWTAGYTARVVAPTSALTECDEGVYSLLVTDFPAPSTWGSVLDAEVLLPDGSHPRVRLYIDDADTALRPGDTVTCTVRFTPTDLIHNQRADYYPAKGVFLFGYADGPVELSAPAASLPLRFAPQYAAKALKEALARIFPADLSGFFIALLTGDKTTMPTGMYAAFQRSGIAHVVVVSGLHIGFLAVVAAWVLGRRSRVGIGILVAVLFFFALLAGSTPSALRAAIMTSLLLVAPLTNREADKATTLATALLALLLSCPYAAASVSLQLSFAAVAGIYVLTEGLQARFWSRIPRWTSLPGRAAGWVLRFLGSSCAVSLGALVFSAPLSALCFQTFSLAGPLTNLLVLWAVSVAFALALCAAAVSAVPVLGTVLAAAAALPARWVIGVAQWVARWPYASLELSFSPVLALWFWLAYALVLVWLFCPRRIRPAIPASVLLVSLCAAVWYSGHAIRASTVTTFALDVGEGASTLFYSQGHAVLVDCGGNAQDDPGDTAANYVQALGHSDLDALVLTHFHSDHTGGVDELFTRLRVARLIIPAIDDGSGVKEELTTLAQGYGCEVIELASDMFLPFGEAMLHIYPPVSKGAANDSGLSAVCAAEGYTALITGDMSSETERRLLQARALSDVDVLLVGHHGAQDSTCPELLKAIHPETAVISTGRNNYGHPSPEVLGRLEQAGCEILRTDELGTIRILCPPQP